MARKTDPERSRTGQRILLIGIAVLFCIGVAIGIVWKRKPLPVVPITRSLSHAVRTQLEVKKNLGVGLLENGEFAEADAIFAEIVTTVPEEKLGLRNQAITRLLAQESGLMSIDQVQSVVDQLVQHDADSSITHLIAGKAAKLSGNLDTAIVQLKRTTELADDAALAYELFQTARYSAEESNRKLARIALHRACALLPKNLYLLTEQILAQAEARDSEIVSSIERANEMVQWLRESIKVQNRVDIRELLDRAEAAAKKGDWQAVLSNVRIFSNVLRPQPATQSDRLRIDKHPLEYVLRDFSSKLDPALAESSADLPPPITVAFQSTAVVEQASTLKNVAALEWTDFDLDGRIELVVLQEDQLRVLSQSEDKSTWQSLIEPVNLSSMNGIVVADLDQDLVERIAAKETTKAAVAADSVCHEADPDLVVFGHSGVKLLRNDKDEATGKRALTTVPQSDALNELRDVLTVSVSDLDHDGDLDLAISTVKGVSLWANMGDMTLIDVSGNSQLPPNDIQATALVPIDWDRDMDFDLLCGSATHSSGYLENSGHGRFRWRSFAENVGSMIAARSIVPVANDPLSSWSLLFGGPQGCGLIKTTISQPGVVQIVPQTVVSGTPASGLLKLDYDNDGVSDLAFWNGEHVHLYHGEPQLKFSDTSTLLSTVVHVGEIRAVKANDFDQDGDLDLIVAGSEGIAVLSNHGGNQNHWINLSLRAEQEKGGQVSASGRVNHYGIGSLIELRSGLNWQAQIVEGAVTHFGVGQQNADVVRVLWTNGVPSNIVQPRSDQQICEKQTLKGSCPYLYTWNGSGYEFYTDLLWNAPIGLQFADGVYAQPRASEYLKVSGDRLKEKDGAYHVQVTEELWEATYFDQIKLLAVDHPADVEIYSNEKVGPAEIAAFKVHTVRQPILPVAARDQRNRNVLDVVRHTDGIFLKAFDKKLRQGLVEEHFLELDLGSLHDPKQITLFLTGWIYPTDTSINVGLGQSSALTTPRPPSIWIPSGTGEWRAAVPFMGFPGGKTKTIAIDLSNLFLTNDYRLRIVTTAEIYWDSAFFTVDESSADFDVVSLPLKSAELHYRGFSARIQNFDNGPESLDYNKVDRAPIWPPMDGRFTRFGDVTELLLEEDDRLVVIGAGDEMSLKFTAPLEPVRAGWKRDFLMFNFGWDKDADLNTVYGQTVEPLPFGEMSGYPYRGDEFPPQSPLYEEYVRRYQTRRQFVRPNWKL